MRKKYDDPKPDATTAAVRWRPGDPVTIAGTAGHDKPEMPVTMPESAVTIIWNDWSRSAGIRSLALGGVDLTSPAGKMTMQVINAVAEFARDLLIERTQAGIRRAKADGKVFGRPSALTGEQRAVVVDRLNAGGPVAQIARDMKTSRQTIMRVREAVAGARS